MSKSEENDQVLTLLREALVKIDFQEKQLQQLTEPIAVVGMGCRFPGGANNPELFWQLLHDGREGIIEVPPDRWDADVFYDPNPDVPGKMTTKWGGFLADTDITKFDANYFNISPREAEYMDPQQRLLLEVTVEALESACIPPKSLSGSLTGVYLGIYTHDFELLLMESQDPEPVEHHTSTGVTASIASGRLSFIFNLKGPNFAVDTACSSSLVALNSACENLHLGSANLAIVAGVNLMLSPNGFIAMSNANMLSPDGRCKTFDASADGFSRAEGCGVVILKRLSDAKKNGDPILAVIKSCGINQDGLTNTITTPSSKSQEELIRNVCQGADVKFDEVDFIETHGTGTALGDPIEVRAIRSTYGQRSEQYPVMLGAVKTNIGHTESVAGMAGLIKVILALNHEEIPPNLNFKKLNPELNLNFPAVILTTSRPWKKGNRVRRAALSSFAYSGTNAHVIIEEAPETESTERSKGPWVLMLSAKTDDALEAEKDNLITYLQSHPEVDLADVAYTLQTGRERFEKRFAIQCHDIDSAIKGLSSDGENVDWDGEQQGEKIALPTYPFQRQRYWAHVLDEAQKERDADKIEHWFYHIDWVEKPSLSTQDITLEERNCLIFGSENEFEKTISKKLSTTIITDSLVALDETITDILFFSSFGTSCEKLLALIQSIVNNNVTPRLWLITQSAQAITEQDTKIDPSQSTLLGFGKVIALEHPELRCVRIDCDADAEQSAESVLSELVSQDNEDEIAYRDSTRYVPRLKEYKPQVNKETVISPEHSYLITGGLGGLGLTLVDWFIAQGAKHLILTARSLPKEEVQTQLDQYQEEGANITVLQGDISQQTDVTTLFSTIEEQHPPLKGIVHAAGVADNDFIANLSWERFQKVIAPKVSGGYHVYEAIQSNKLDLDFLVFFSSISGTLGSMTTSAYAAANYYLDNLAQLASYQGIPAMSIAWGPWSEVGMAHGEEERELALGYRLISPELGVNAFELALLDGSVNQNVVSFHWPTYFANLSYHGRIYSHFETKEQKSAKAELWVDAFAKITKSPPEKRIIMLEMLVGDVVKNVLGLSQMQAKDKNKNFFNMGMDSLMAMEIRNHLQFAVQKNLLIPNALLFDQPSVSKISDFLHNALLKKSPAETEQGSILGEVLLTPNQQWFFEQTFVEKHHFNQSRLISIIEPIDWPVMQTALMRLINHHDSLRMRFDNEGNNWQQSYGEIVDETAAKEYAVSYDLKTASDETERSTLENTMALMQASLNLAEGPLIRMALFELNDNRRYLYIVIHHLVIDGVSWQILLDDLMDFYDRCQREDNSVLKKTTSVQYWASQCQTYIAEGHLDDELSYWQSVVAAIDTNIPCDKSGDDNTVGNTDTLIYTLGAKETDHLVTQIHQAYNTNMNDILLTALLIAYHRWCDQTCLSLSLEGDGREPLFSDVDLSRTIGWFSTLFPVNLTAPETEELAKWIITVKESLHQIPLHGISYGLLRYFGKAREFNDQTPQISFSYTDQITQIGDCSIQYNGVEEQRYKKGFELDPRNKRSHLLEVSATLHGGCFSIHWTYSKAHHEQSSIQALAEGYQKALKEIIDHCLEPSVGTFTSSDFPYLDVSQEELDFIINKLAESQNIPSSKSIRSAIETIYKYADVPTMPGAEEVVDYNLSTPLFPRNDEQLAFIINGPFDEDAFKKTWEYMMKRHALLRASFHMTNNSIIIVEWKDVQINWKHLDWSNVSPEDQEREFKKLSDEDLWLGYDLAKTPLWRNHMIRLSATRHQFVINFWHYIVDGMSYGIILQELMHAYISQTQQGKWPSLPKPLSYGAHLDHLREVTQKIDQRYLDTIITHNDKYKIEDWSDRLESSFPAHKIQNFESDEIEVCICYKTLSRLITKMMAEFSKKHGITIATLIHGILGLTLNHYSKINNIAFFTIDLGRNFDLMNIDTAVGTYVQLSPVSIEINTEQRFTNYLTELQNQLAQSRQHTPHDFSRLIGTRPVPFSIVNVLIREKGFLHNIDLPIDFSISDEKWRTSNYHYLMFTIFLSHEIDVRITYSPEYFKEDQINELFEHFKRFLELSLSDTIQLIGEITGSGGTSNGNKK